MQSVFRGSLRGWVEVGVQPKGRRRVWEYHNSSVKLSLNAVFPACHDGTVYSIWLHQLIDHIRPSWCHGNLCMKLAPSWLPWYCTFKLLVLNTMAAVCQHFVNTILCAAKDTSHLLSRRERQTDDSSAAITYLQNIRTKSHTLSFYFKCCTIRTAADVLYDQEGQSSRCNVLMK